jgi:hypothetical protein
MSWANFVFHLSPRTQGYVDSACQPQRLKAKHPRTFKQTVSGQCTLNGRIAPDKQAHFVDSAGYSLRYSGDRIFLMYDFPLSFSLK